MRSLALLMILTGACATQGGDGSDDGLDGKMDGFSKLTQRTYIPSADDYLANPPRYFGYLVLKSDNTFLRSNKNLPNESDGSVYGRYELKAVGSAKHIVFTSTSGTQIDDWEYTINDYSPIMKRGTTTFSLDPSITAQCRVADDCRLQTLPACTATVTCTGGTTKTCGCPDTQSTVITDAKTKIKSLLSGFPAANKVAVSMLPSNAKLQYHLLRIGSDPSVYETTTYKLTVDSKPIFVVFQTDNDTFDEIYAFDGAGWQIAYGQQTEQSAFRWID